MLPENHTDKIQPIDTGCGQKMNIWKKLLLWTDGWRKRTILRKWQQKDRRVLMTQWTGEAWTELKQNGDQVFNEVV